MNSWLQPQASSKVLKYKQPEAIPQMLDEQYIVVPTPVMGGTSEDTEATPASAQRVCSALHQS